MTVLYFYPSNPRSVQLESEFLSDIKEGNQVHLLTTCAEGKLHNACKEMGIKVATSVIPKSNSFLYYIRQVKALKQYVKQNNIDIIKSNLQHCNLITVLAYPKWKKKGPEIQIFRHHFKFLQFKGPSTGLQKNKGEALFDRIINLLAKKQYVPSTGVRDGMIQYEGLKPSKIILQAYQYDFSRYQFPQEEDIQAIKQKYPAQLRIIMVSRLIPFKRHLLVLPVFQKLINEGLDIQVFILDQGPEQEHIQSFIQEHKLEENIHLLGFRSDFLAYMGASDVLVHPSLTEASNSVVKEMGLMGKAVMVMDQVGDFHEYIEHEKNGILLSADGLLEEIESYIRKGYAEKGLFSTLGGELKDTVLKKFS